LKKLIFFLFLFSCFSSVVFPSSNFDKLSLLNTDIGTKEVGFESIKSYKQRKSLYQNQSKDVGAAFLVSFFAPSLGHLYSEDWRRAIPFLLVELGGLALAADGANKHALSGGANGFLIFMIARVWECFDAADAANMYNQALRRRLGVAFEQGFQMQTILLVSQNF
jgi:hypothetical protein